MTQLKGKQLQDASLDIKKLTGITPSVPDGKFILSGVNQSAQALSLSGDLEQSISGATLSLVVSDQAIDFDKLHTSVLVTESAGLNSSDNDTTVPTTAAVKDYVDSNISSSANPLNFAGDTGSDSIVISTDTFSFVGGSNITTEATDNQLSIALDSDILIASADITGDLTVGGNLTVNGTITTVNSTEVEIADATFRLGAGTSTAATLAASGAGIIFGEDAAGVSFTIDSQLDFASTQSIDLQAGKVFKIANAPLLSEEGVAKVQSAVAGDGLTREATGSMSVQLHADGGLQYVANSGLALAGFEIDHYNVSATITSGNIVTDTSGNLTKPSAVGNIDLKVNGISYRQGLSTAGDEQDWYFDNSDNLVWHGSFPLDSDDLVSFHYTGA